MIHAKRPLPNQWASLDDNFDSVSLQTKQKFPQIVSVDHYNWQQGYMMGFWVRKNTTAQQRKQIHDYAMPLWVQIRRWDGMGSTSSQCQVNVY